MAFRESMRQARDRSRAELKLESRSPEERRALTFVAFWARVPLSGRKVSLTTLRWLRHVEERGLNRLLDVRPVRLAVGAGMSLTYYMVVEGGDSQVGDAYDLLHAVMASVARRFGCADAFGDRSLDSGRTGRNTRP